MALGVRRLLPAPSVAAWEDEELGRSPTSLQKGGGHHNGVSGALAELEELASRSLIELLTGLQKDENKRLPWVSWANGCLWAPCPYRG